MRKESFNAKELSEVRFIPNEVFLPSFISSDIVSFCDKNKETGIYSAYNFKKIKSKLFMLWN